jgi:hypothetical protein
MEHSNSTVQQYTDGQQVNYHGSLTEMHGPAYYWGLCTCRNDSCWRVELETFTGYLLQHVDDDAFSPAST